MECTIPRLNADASLDRYRDALKGTWKDEASSACGQTYDLGSHLIDQTLVLFGRPKSITAFIENARNIGDPDVDDSVRLSSSQRGSSHDVLPSSPSFSGTRQARCPPNLSR
jgi:predicted dehydrogenase